MESRTVQLRFVGLESLDLVEIEHGLSSITATGVVLYFEDGTQIPISENVKATLCHRFPRPNVNYPSALLLSDYILAHGIKEDSMKPRIWVSVAEAIWDKM
jgi:hypothetical protein